MAKQLWLIRVYNLSQVQSREIGYLLRKFIIGKNYLHKQINQLQTSSTNRLLTTKAYLLNRKKYNIYLKLIEIELFLFQYSS